jgi:hypothetical protein
MSFAMAFKRLETNLITLIGQRYCGGVLFIELKAQRHLDDLKESNIPTIKWVIAISITLLNQLRMEVSYVNDTQVSMPQ